MRATGNPASWLLPACSALAAAVLLGLSPEVTAQVRAINAGDGLQCIAYSADGRFLATGGMSRVVKIWDLYSGVLALSIDLPVKANEVAEQRIEQRKQDNPEGWKQLPEAHKQLLLFGSTVGVAYSPDGRLLAVKFQHSTATTQQSANVFLCDATAGTVTATIEMSYNPISFPVRAQVMPFDVGRAGGGGGGGFGPARCPSVAFSSDGMQVMAAEGELHVWDREGKPIRSLRMDSGFCNCFAVSKDYDVIAQIRSGGVLEVSDLLGKRVFRQEFRSPPSAVAISADARYVAVANKDRISVYTVPKGRIKFARRQAGTREKVTAVAISPNGEFFASGNDVGMVEVTDDENRNTQAYLPTLPDRVVAVTFSPDGKTVGYASASGIVRLQDLPQE